MNCTEARDRLPHLLYADLPSSEAAAVENHLAACATCRQEYAALRQLRPLLDATPAPAVSVDLPRLYQEAARLRERQLRRAVAADHERIEDRNDHRMPAQQERQ